MFLHRMEASIKKFNQEQPENPNAWLWGEEDLSDVAVKLQITPVVPGQNAEPLAEDADDLSNGEQVFHLHTTVLCSGSMYFRTRITTAVGGSGSKRSRCETLVEVLDAEQGTASSVLKFFYTSHLPSHDHSSYLLQMLKVSMIFLN